MNLRMSPRLGKSRVLVLMAILRYIQVLDSFHIKDTLILVFGPHAIDIYYTS